MFTGEKNQHIHIQVSDTIRHLYHVVHPFYFVLRCYDKQLFIILYRMLMINAIRNSPLCIKHPAIWQMHCHHCWSRKSVGLCWLVVILVH